MSHSFQRNNSPDLFDDFMPLNEVAMESAHGENLDATQTTLEDQPIFSCTGRIEDAESYLSEQAWFLAKEESDLLGSRSFGRSNFTCESVENIFPFAFDFVEISLRNAADAATIFKLLRMWLRKLEALCDRRDTFVFSDVHSSESQDLRRQICLILSFVKTGVYELLDQNNIESKDALRYIVFEFKGALLQIGRIHLLPFANFSNTANQHYFHACLDVWYYAVKTFLSVHNVFGDSAPNVTIADYASENDVDNFSRGSIAEQIVDVVVSDLITLSISKFSDEISPKDDLWCYPCACVLKFWALLRRLVDCTFKREKHNGFWSRFSNNFSRFLTPKECPNRLHYSDRFTVPYDPKISMHATPSSYWRFLRCLSCFRQQRIYADCPHEDVTIRAILESLISKTILPSVTTNDEHFSMATETKLRQFLFLYLSVALRYNAYTTTLPLALWDFNFKRINNAFSLQDLDELRINATSAHDWLVDIRRLAQNFSGETTERRNSFELFLAIVATHCDIEKDTRIWNQMKGRIFTKLTSRKIEELSERGLFNCLNFLLVVANFIDLKLITARITELFANLPLQQSAGVSKQKMVWRALTVLVMLHQERNLECDAICEYLCTSFRNVHQFYTRCRADVAVRRDCWDLIVYYIQLLHESAYFKSEISKVSDENYLRSQSILWSCDFQQLFSQAKDVGDLRRQHQVEFSRACAEILRRLASDLVQKQKWTGILEKLTVVLRTILCNAPPWFDELMDAWMHLTALSTSLDFKFSPSTLFIAVTEARWDVFEPRQACRYLQYLIRKPEIFARILSTENNEEKQVIAITKIWLRCALLTPRPCDSVLDVGRYVAASSPWKNVLPDSGSYKDHEHIFSEMCAALERRISTNPQERFKIISLAQSVFSPPVKHLIQLLMSTEPSDAYFHCAKLLAGLVEHCAPFIHQRANNDSLLKDIVGATVCCSCTEKTDAQVRRNRYEMAAFCLLPMLRGLMKCDWSQDAFIRQRIVDCYRIELVRLADERMGAIMDANALVISLADTFSESASLDSPVVSLRKFLIKDIRIFVTSQFTNTKQICRTAVSFLRCLVEKTRSAEIFESESEEIFCCCLTLWMLHEDRSIIGDCVELIDICQRKFVKTKPISAYFVRGLAVIFEERCNPSTAQKIIQLAVQLCKRYPTAKSEIAKTVPCFINNAQKRSGSGENLKFGMALNEFETFASADP